MGYEIGYDPNWKRDIGYGVLAICDHPKCITKIDRGLAHVCGSLPYGGGYGCGLYFCDLHLVTYRKPRGSDRFVELCSRCEKYRTPFKPKQDTPAWIKHKMTHPSWKKWRKENNIK